MRPFVCAYILPLIISSCYVHSNRYTTTLNPGETIGFATDRRIYKIMHVVQNVIGESFAELQDRREREVKLNSVNCRLIDHSLARPTHSPIQPKFIDRLERASHL